MSIPRSAENIAQIFKLAKLKNVSGRRVMPGEEAVEAIESPANDVSGTANTMPKFGNFLPPEPKPNEPEPDRGGELTSQSYDVRANAVNPPPAPPQNQGFLHKMDQMIPRDEQGRSPLERLGSSLSKLGPFGGTEGAAASQQVPVQNENPVVNAAESAQAVQPEQEAISSKPGLLAKIGETATKLGPYTGGIGSAIGKVISEAQTKTKSQEELNAQVSKALEAPWQEPVVGAAQQAANDPTAQQQFEQMSGTKLDPSTVSTVSSYEQAMQGVEDSLKGLNTQLDAQAESIRERILNNQSTDSDKYYIGLALAMPLLIGGFFGAEAGLGALGGSAGGVAEVLGRRQEGIREDEGSLRGISKQQAENQGRLAELGLKRAQMAPAGPNPNDVKWEDPLTGEVLEGRRIKPGLIARPEYVGTPEQEKEMLKAAGDLAPMKAYTQDVNEITENIINIASQLDDPSVLQKGLVSVLSNAGPGVLSHISQDVMVNGQKQNAGIALQNQIGLLKVKYAQSQGLGQIDAALQRHLSEVVANPASTFVSSGDSVMQVLNIRKAIQRSLINAATASGFHSQPLISEMQEQDRRISENMNRKKETQDIEQEKESLY